MARDYKAEYRRRVERGLARGLTRREASGRRARVSPAGLATGDVDSAESLIRRLPGRAVVKVTVKLRAGGRLLWMELFPRGGVRASTLAKMINDVGRLEPFVLDKYYDLNGPVAVASRRNGRMRSPSVRDDLERQQEDVTIEEVTIQWRKAP